MSRYDDDPAVERGAQILLALQRYQRSDGDKAELLALLARPDLMSRVARCGSAIKGAYAWLMALVEQEVPPPMRSQARGRR